MERFLKTLENLSEENRLLLKKSLAAGVVLYILLLAIHDLLPYALVFTGAWLGYRALSEEGTT